ncbi:MAG: LptF/LptG family permease [Janthinobacterium lividum]
MIKRLDRYLLGEMVLPFVGGILLIVVMLVGNTLFPLIEDIVKQGIPPLIVARLIVFNLPILIPLTLPPGVALASAWAVNRLARDSEITAIRMAGVSLKRLFLPIILVGVLSSIASFLVGDRLVPPAWREFQKTQSQLFAYALQASPTVAANKVFTFQDYSFHIREIRKDPTGKADKLQLFGLLIFQNPVGSDGFATAMSADSADYDHDVWTLHGAHLITFEKTGFVATETAGRTIKLNLQVPIDSLAGTAADTPDDLSMAQLGAQKAALERTGQDSTSVSFNYYSKVGLPFLCLGFALCAPPLALRFARAGAYMGIFLSIIMVWVAWNTLLLTKILGIAGKMPPELAAWSPALLFIGLGLYFLWQME